VDNTLYRRSYDQLWLRCVSGPEAEHVMKEMHSRLCGAHQFGPKMKLKIKRMGYYWPTMVADCEDHAKKCRMCQIHDPFIHQAPNPLHPTVASWPFSMWGTNIVGPIDPPTSRGHRFILAATDYFTKWTKAVPLKEVKASDVVKFFKTHISIDSAPRSG
jgi:Integrase zinc binding domain